MKKLGEKLELFEVLRAAAVVMDEEEIKTLIDFKNRGLFKDIVIINSEYEYHVAKKGRAMKLAVRKEVYPKIRHDAVKHYHVITD